MFERANHRGGHYLLLSALAGFLFFVNLGGPSLWDVDEGRNITCAYEMMESGNWVVPTFNGHLRDHKPALLYWLQIFAFQLFGINEFAARFPSALAALATVLVVYELGRALFGQATGLLAGIVIASTPMLCGAARFANPDSLLNLFITLTLTLFWLSLKQRTTPWFIAIGLACGGGVLAKGPVGFVLPAGIIGLYLIWQREFRLLFDRRWLHAIVVMLLVALPWYILVAVETRASFLDGFIRKHNVDRFLNPMENHSGSPFFYVIVLLVGLTPWSVFIGPALWYGAWSAFKMQPSATPSRAHSWWQSAAEPKVEGYRFLGCWLLTYVIFFSIAATKLPNYVLPAVVPLAVLLARFLERWRCGEIRVPRWVAVCSLVCLVSIGVALAVGLTIAGGVVWPELLRGRIYPGLEIWAGLGALPIIAACGGAWCLRQERRTGLVACVAAAAVLLIGPLAAFACTAFNSFKAPQPLVDEAGILRPNEDVRIGSWQLELLPSLNFYVRRDVIHHPSETEALKFLRYPLRVYLFLPATEWDRLKSHISIPCRVVARHADMYHHGDVVVVTNR